MTKWRAYPAASPGDEKTVAGNVQLLRDLHSPQLGNSRDLLVYLPPSYELGDRRYPVLYFQDGQNLFDEATSYAGAWRVDEVMESLSQEGIEAIVVGIPNAGTARMDEYSPFAAAGFSAGLGDRYLDFIAGTVKPIVDRDFRTRPGREHTAIAGSSMGGLISLYAFFHCSELFSLAASMSPSLWFARKAIFSYVAEAPYVPGRIYLDAGTREHGDSGLFSVLRLQSRRYYASVRRMHRLLAKKGYRPRRDLLYVEEKWAAHDEGAWARRLPGAIRFLFEGK